MALKAEFAFTLKELKIWLVQSLNKEIEFLSEHVAHVATIY